MEREEWDQVTPVVRTSAEPIHAPLNYNGGRSPKLAERFRGAGIGGVTMVNQESATAPLSKMFIGWGTQCLGEFEAPVADQQVLQARMMTPESICQADRDRRRALPPPEHILVTYRVRQEVTLV